MQKKCHSVWSYSWIYFPSNILEIEWEEKKLHWKNELESRTQVQLSSEYIRNWESFFFGPRLLCISILETNSILDKTNFVKVYSVHINCVQVPYSDELCSIDNQFKIVPVKRKMDAVIVVSSVFFFFNVWTREKHLPKLNQLPTHTRARA